MLSAPLSPNVSHYSMIRPNPRETPTQTISRRGMGLVECYEKCEVGGVVLGAFEYGSPIIVDDGSRPNPSLELQCVL